jgi:hypothetical protein
MGGSFAVSHGLPSLLTEPAIEEALQSSDTLLLGYGNDIRDALLPRDTDVLATDVLADPDVLAVPAKSSVSELGALLLLRRGALSWLLLRLVASLIALLELLLLVASLIGRLLLLLLLGISSCILLRLRFLRGLRGPLS